MIGWTLPGAIAAADEPASAPRYQVVKDAQGVWWFQGPEGRRFYSLGVNNVSPEPYQPRAGTRYYNPVPAQFKGDVRAWGEFVSQLLRSNGFNTLGAWSSNDAIGGDALMSTPVLYLVEHDGDRCLSPLRADFEEFVQHNLDLAIAKLPDRQHILGVFLDNEMPWFGKSGWDDIPNYTLLERALELPRTDERHQAAVAFLKSRHNTAVDISAAYQRPLDNWESLDSSWMRSSMSAASRADREAFTRMIADKYFEVTTRLVRKHLPGLLILGTRFPGSAPAPVIEACGRHCDVVSVNEYRFEPKVDELNLARFHLLGKRPLMHTEFSWRARQNASGNPNSRGAGAVVETQAERAAAYSGLVSDIATVPYVIGSHWFEFADQSPEGRFDGENSNYGMVDIHNQPYSELLSAMKATNARVQDLHAGTTRRMPTELPTSTVTFSPGQHPGRPPRVELLTSWIQEPEIWGAPDAKLSWKRPAGGEGIALTFDTGTQYGAGINIFGPAAMKLDHGPADATDLDGYSAVVIDATAPKGLQINVVLAEAGSGPSTALKFDESGGDDGEAFVSAPVMGDGARRTYRLPIAELQKQKFFGNQRGRSRIDMNAVRSLGIQVSGTPQHGEVIVHSFRLER